MNKVFINIRMEGDKDWGKVDLDELLHNIDMWHREYRSLEHLTQRNTYQGMESWGVFFENNMKTYLKETRAEREVE